MNYEEATVSGYLKEYVKEKDITTLSTFFRFFTGCDLMVALDLSSAFTMQVHSPDALWHILAPMCVNRLLKMTVTLSL